MKKISGASSAEFYADSVLQAEQIQAIGYVAIESANLEILVERMICSILFLENATRQELVERRQLSAKLTILRALVNERLAHHAEKDEFKQDLHSYRESTRLISGRCVV